MAHIPGADCAVAAQLVETPSTNPEPGAAAEGTEQRVLIVHGNLSHNFVFSQSLYDDVKRGLDLKGNLQFRDADAETNQIFLELSEIEERLRAKGTHKVVLSLTLDGEIIPAIYSSNTQRKPSTVKADRRHARNLYGNSCLRAQIEIMDDHIEATSGNYRYQEPREVKVSLDFNEHDYVSKVKSQM